MSNPNNPKTGHKADAASKAADGSSVDRARLQERDKTSPLLSPFALMALGLAGVATAGKPGDAGESPLVAAEPAADVPAAPAATSTEDAVQQTTAAPQAAAAADTAAAPAAADAETAAAPAAADAETSAAPAPDVASPAEAGGDVLVAAADVEALPVAEGGLAEAAGVAADSEPILVAQLDAAAAGAAGAGGGTAAGSTAAATAAATTAAEAAAIGGITAGSAAAAAGLAAVAIGVGSAVSSDDPVDNTPPAAPTGTLARDTGSSSTDGITADGTVNVGGLEAGATWAFSVDGGKTWTAGTGTSFKLADGSYAADAIQVRQTDSAGAVSTTTGKIATALTVDSAIGAPSLALAQDTGSSASDGITSVGTVNVSGLDVGASWEFSSNGGTSWAAGSGSSFTLAAGNYAADAVQVRQTDVAGNVSSAAKVSTAVSVDNAAAAPVLALAVDSGGSASDSVTKDGTVNVAGLEAGASWQYSTDGGTSWTDGSGSSFTLAAGSYAANDVQARQTDAAGNAGDAGKVAAATTVDQTAPGAPTAVLASDTGSSTSDGITSNGMVNVSGLEAGASWQYSTNAGSTWAAGSGSSVTLAAGSYAANAVQVRQIDVAGNTGTATAKIGTALNVDSSAATPVLALAVDSGSSNSDGISSGGAVNVTGLETGASWEYSTNAGSTWTAGSGSSFTLAAGSYAANAVQARQTDVAGNVSSAGRNTAALTVDQTAPAAPAAALAQDAGSSASDGITRNGTVNVTGLEAGASWEYSTNSGATWATGSGSSFVLAAGTYAADALQVRQTDAAGNLGATTGTIATAVTVDTTVTAPVLALAADTGSSASDGITSNGTVNVTGLEAGASWEYSSNSGATWAAGSGSSFTLAAGVQAANSVQVRQTDVAGNTSTAGSIASAVTVDTTVAAPTLALGQDTGSNASDGITRSGTIDVTGLEAGASWEYSSNSGATWAAGSGSSFSLAAGAYAANAVQVRQTDLAGNTGSAGTLAAALTVDQTDPAAPAAALAQDTGTAGDGITKNGTINVSGLETSASWEYSTNSGSTWTAGSGSSFVLDTGVYAANRVQVRQADLAGNFSTAGSVGVALEVLEGAKPPAAALAVDTGVVGDGITSNGTVNVTALATGATWEFSTDSGTSWTAGTGSSFSLAAGSYTASAVQVRQTNQAGDTSAPAIITSAITVDTTAAAAPALALLSDTGSSASDGITSNGTVNVTGLETGASWEYSTNSGSTWTAGSGSSFALAAGAQAAGTVQVRQSDVAGNTSNAGSNAAALTVDTTAPTLTAANASTNATTGAQTFHFDFVEAVTGFDASDVVVVNGATSNFVTTDASHYTVDITPTSSTTPLELTVNVAAGAASDLAGNTSAAVAQLLQSVLYGTAGNDTLTTGAALDQVFLGTGNDTIKLAAASGSTLAATDVVRGFGSGDHIDLSALLGTGVGGAGYSQAVPQDVGAGFVELQSLTLTQNATAGTTTVRFNLDFDAATLGGSKIAGAVFDLAYDYSAARTLSITNPTYTDPGTGDPVSVWQATAANVANGKIAVGADQSTLADNTIIDATGKALGVTLVLNGLRSTFAVGLEAKAAGGLTEVVTEDNVVHNVDVGVTKAAGGPNGVLEIIQDTGTLGTVGDNQLHLVSSYDAATNLTHLQVQYDTNAVSGAGNTTLSSVIAMDFVGDVHDLIPPALTYVFP